MAWFLCMLLAAAPSTSRAARSNLEEAEVPPGAVLLRVGGAYQVAGTALSPIRIDRQGHRLGQSALVHHRLGLTSELQLATGATIHGDLQLATGYLFVDAPNPLLLGHGLPRDRSAQAFASEQHWQDQLRLRKLYLRWMTPVGLLSVGRMASDWGLGLLANSGDREDQDFGGPRFGADFGYGDVVNRVLLASAPWAAWVDHRWAKRLTLALGADVIERDERTELGAGDLGRQGVGVLRFATEGDELGLYVAYRDLHDRNGETLRAWAYDFYGKGSTRVGPWQLFAAAEVAVVAGVTTLARNNGVTGPQSLQQLGWVTRVGARDLPFGVSADLEVGYASGDSNPNDAFVRNFSFDPDYNPSLILFEELRASESAAAAAHASDPARVGKAPTAARLMPTDGAVSNAIYLRPILRFVHEGFGARLAVLWARAEEPVVDPVSSTLAGGAARNYQGGDGNERGLGVEVNLGVDYRLQALANLEFAASLQGGQLWPGMAFADAKGRKPRAVRVAFVRLVARWLPEPAVLMGHRR